MPAGPNVSRHRAFGTCQALYNRIFGESGKQIIPRSQHYLKLATHRIVNLPVKVEEKGGPPGERPCPQEAFKITGKGSL